MVVLKYRYPIINMECKKYATLYRGTFFTFYDSVGKIQSTTRISNELLQKVMRSYFKPSLYY